MADNETMDVDEPQPVAKAKKEGKDNGKARFEVKKASVESILIPLGEGVIADM